MKERSLNNTCEEKTFSSLYDQYADEINNYVYYKFGYQVEAAEAVQQAFIKLWKNCQKVDPYHARAFLYKVASNLSLNVIKHEKIKLKYAKESDKKVATHEDPAFEMETDEFKNKLETALAALNEKQRTTFLMHRIDGMSYKEIAATEDISIKAVEKRMHQALVNLRDKIKNI